LASARCHRFGTCVVAFGLQGILSQGPELAFHDRSPATIAITEADWRTRIWRTLPQIRDDLRKTGHHPLNLQYAGRLADQGWEPGPRLSWGTAIKLLSPPLPLTELPVIPHVHQGRYETLTLVKHSSPNSRLVLRLWPTGYRIDGKMPLWIGSITTQHKRVILDLLVVPTTDTDTRSPLDSVQEDFSALHPFRPDWTAPLLLQIP